MSQANPAVLVDRVSKSFVLPNEQVHTLKERALHPFRRSGYTMLEALRDVSFSVGRGEFFGIVGRNGSGQSTMLKCLAGIYGTDAGNIYVDGRMSAFIELGVGFNMDLPARDNVQINATMLGLSPKEGLRRFDAIVDFAELHEFVDLKLKNYSSGMLVRLAFSVMVQVDAEILLIDEVLAVGDLAFQQKCFDKFEEVRRDGKTVLLVTHDMNAVHRFCDRALLMEHGQLVEIGDPDLVGRRYQELNFSEEARQRAKAGLPPAEIVLDPIVEPEPEPEVAGADATEPEPELDPSVPRDGARFGDQTVAEILDVGFDDEVGARVYTLELGRRCALAFIVRFHERVHDPHFELDLQNTHGDIVFATQSETRTGTFEAGDEVMFRVSLDNVFAPDRYHLSASVRRREGGEWYDYRQRVISAVVTGRRTSEALVVLPHEIDLLPWTPSGDAVAAGTAV
jgi:ABC-type polysaccharide/polyol phosphate transport system ATPase subunit